MLKVFQRDFHFVDERGTIDQLVHEGYKQVNVITSKKGVARGGHYHKLNKEAFYIISGSLTITVNGESRHFGAGDFFGIDENDMHSFDFEEDTLLVSMYSEGVVLEDGRKDMYEK